MNTAAAFTVKFTIASEDRYTALVSAYGRIRECKSADAWPEKKEDWAPYFDAKALSHFWWPTDAELEGWKHRYFSTPVPKRFTDPSLQHPWDFLSMFDAFKNGDYALLPIERISSSEAVLMFDPFAYPFGGTGCMRALIEAFDHRITHDDGSLEVKPKRWWRFWKQ
jgi:hypothetical protein